MTRVNQAYIWPKSSKIFEKIITHFICKKVIAFIAYSLYRIKDRIFKFELSLIFKYQVEAAAYKNLPDQSTETKRKILLAEMLALSLEEGDEDYIDFSKIENAKTQETALFLAKLSLHNQA